MYRLRACAVAAISLLAAPILGGSAPAAPLSTNIVNDVAAPVEISWLHARQTGKGISVNGFVRRAGLNRGLASGHIEIEVRLADQSLHHHCIRWGHIPRRGLQGVAFAAVVTVPTASPAEHVEGRYAPNCMGGAAS